MNDRLDSFAEIFYIMKKTPTKKYLIFSFVLALITGYDSYLFSWWDAPIQVLPNLIGFSLGGYAILMSIGNERLLRLLAESDDNEFLSDLPYSKYMQISSILLQYILIQTVAVIFAFVGKSGFQRLGSDFLNYLTIGETFIVGVTSFVGHLIFIYSLVFTISLASSLFRLSSWNNQSLVKNNAENVGLNYFSHDALLQMNRIVLIKPTKKYYDSFLDSLYKKSESTIFESIIFEEFDYLNELKKEAFLHEISDMNKKDSVDILKAQHIRDILVKMAFLWKNNKLNYKELRKNSVFESILSISRLYINGRKANVIDQIADEV